MVYLIKDGDYVLYVTQKIGSTDGLDLPVIRFSVLTQPPPFPRKLIELQLLVHSLNPDPPVACLPAPVLDLDAVHSPAEFLQLSLPVQQCPLLGARARPLTGRSR